MRYWVVRAKPAWNDPFEDWIIPKSVGRWQTKRPPRAWEKGDRVFVWASSPRQEILGLSELHTLPKNPDREGRYWFRLNYLSGVLRKPIERRVLSANPLLRKSILLKSGPSFSVVRLTDSEGEELYRLVAQRNPETNDIWPELLSKSSTLAPQEHLKMAVSLDDSCVYTIATPERLLEASKFQLPLHESKSWVSAAKYLKNAHNAGRVLPIVFANSRDCSKLIAWSVLRSVVIAPKETSYTIGQLWAVPRSRPQDLQLLNSKKHIAEGFIKPYAMCQTPDFLRVESKKPRGWLPSDTAIREVREGKRRLTAHMRLERNRGIVNASKKQWMQKHNGRLPCEICGFDFLEAYGPIGAGFAEAHHRKSLAGSPKGGRVTSLNDFVVVCANCHRMLHRTPELPSVDALRTRTRNSAKKGLRGK